MSHQEASALLGLKRLALRNHRQRNHSRVLLLFLAVYCLVAYQENAIASGPVADDTTPRACTLSKSIAVLLPEGTELQEHLSRCGYVLLNDLWLDSSSKWEDLAARIDGLAGDRSLLFIVYSSEDVPKDRVQQLKEETKELCENMEIPFLNFVARMDPQRWKRLQNQFRAYLTDKELSEDGIGNSYAKAFVVKSPFSVESTREATVAGIILKPIKDTKKFPRAVLTSLSVCLRNLETENKQNLFVKLPYSDQAGKIALNFRRESIENLRTRLGYETWTIWLRGEQSGYITWKQ